MAATNKYGMSKRKWPEQDSLFFKFQGPSSASLQESARIVENIVKRHGGTGFELAKTDQEAVDLWADRKNAYYSGMALIDGCKGWSTDVWYIPRRPLCYCCLNPSLSVPVSKLPELVYETKKDIAKMNLTSIIVGHVGDGNFHALVLFTSDEEFRRAEEVVDRMVKRAIALDGTCMLRSLVLLLSHELLGTGEHGVGIGKKKYLVEELGVGTVDLMKKIKKAVDPLGLFNPGKVRLMSMENKFSINAHEVIS